jgi:hypothetical protein
MGTRLLGTVLAGFGTGRRMALALFLPLPLSKDLEKK